MVLDDEHISSSGWFSLTFSSQSGLVFDSQPPPPPPSWLGLSSNQNASYFYFSLFLCFFINLFVYLSLVFLVFSLFTCLKNNNNHIAWSELTLG